VVSGQNGIQEGGFAAMSRVLIVEDQKRLLNSLRRGLEEEGYEVALAATGEDGFYLATTQSFDALVLDLMLPGRDGLQILKELRGNGFGKPVLILTSRDAVEDRVKGLDCGADDYLVKPFAFAELLARLRALLRRNTGERELVLRADNLQMDLVAWQVVRNGIELNLSNREFELLEFFLRHRNMVVTREMIGREVWKEPDGVWTNVIEVCINALRKKIEQPGQKQLIHTVRGVGYALRDL
jgi:two-component system copper resistance phosphate regulon response regulator CusR